MSLVLDLIGNWNFDKILFKLNKKLEIFADRLESIFVEKLIKKCWQNNASHDRVFYFD